MTQYIYIYTSIFSFRFTLDSIMDHNLNPSLLQEGTSAWPQRVGRRCRAVAKISIETSSSYYFEVFIHSFMWESFPNFRLSKYCYAAAPRGSHRPARFPFSEPPCTVRHWYWKLWVEEPSLSLKHARRRTGGCPLHRGDAARLRNT